MATYLPGSGAISINDINTLFGRGNNLNAYRGTTYYTSSAGPFTFSSGAIAMSDFYNSGPSASTFSFTISSNTTNANLRSLAISAGWSGSGQLFCTIGSGVYVYSTSTGTPALTISGSFPNGVSLTNNGVILGAGGAGSQGYNNRTAGGGGGTALSVSSAVTITNNGTVAGGGGGGGGGGGYLSGGTTWTVPGGGGGGGIGNGAAGPGNSSGVQTANPGTAGTLTSAGTGGINPSQSQVPGGNGGSYGSSGGTGGTPTLSRGTNIAGNAGGAGGACTSGNANITWAATGTRYGALN